jgi:hypothetical protein
MVERQSTAIVRVHASSQKGKWIDFESININALKSAQYLLFRWFPAGRIYGQEFQIGNLRGDCGDSLRISLTKGCWIDFARPDDRGSDLVALTAARMNLPQREAAKLLCAELGIAVPTKTFVPERRRAAPFVQRGAVELPSSLPEVLGEQRWTASLARRIWSERISLNGSPAWIYLRSRGVSVGKDIDDLAFHPHCPRGNSTAPAMLALLRDACTLEPIGVHRTFIRLDGSGKAGGSLKSKMMLGRAKNAIIMLTPTEDVTLGLGIAEGIENALTILSRGWAPVWACCSAGGIGHLPVLGGIRELTIFADRDKAGLNGTRDCAIRWVDAGKAVTVHLPHSGMGDWNDIHLRRAAA